MLDFVECVLSAQRIQVPLLRESRLKICDFNLFSCMLSCKKPVCPLPDDSEEFRRNAAKHAGESLQEVLDAYNQIEQLLKPYPEDVQIPASVLAQAEQLRLRVDEITGGNLERFLQAEQIRLEAEWVREVGPEGEFRGDQPSYPIHYAYEVVETRTRLSCPFNLTEVRTNVIRGMTQPFAQYQIFLQNSPNRNPMPVPCPQGRIYGESVRSELRRIAFFDPRTLRAGDAYTRRIPGLASGISGFLLKPTFAATDSDSDALPDTVEWILGTDPSNPDSDQDGIPDGAELEGNANPLNGRQAAIGIIASAALSGTAMDIAAFNDLAAVALNTAGVAILDIRDARSPVVTAIVKTPGEALAVAIGTRQVIVADGSRGFTLIDLNSPAGPVLGRNRTLDSPALSATASGEFGFIGTQSGTVAVVELSSGTVLQRVAVNERVDDLVLTGDRLFVVTATRLIAYRWEDFQLSYWGATELSGFQQTESITGRRRLALLNNTAFITAYPGYGTVDVADPMSMKILSPPVDFAPNSFKQLVPTGSGQALAVVGVNPGQLNPLTHNVQLWDISDLQDPTRVMNQFTTPGLARAATIYNGIGFVADGEAGLQVVSYLPFDTAKNPPQLSLFTSAVQDSVETGKLLRLTAVVADDVQVRNVEFIVDGARVAIDGNAPFEFAFTVPKRTETKTQLLIQARARDTGGNSTVTPEFILQIGPDQTPPRLSPWAPLPRGIAGAVKEVGILSNEPLDPGSISQDFLELSYSGADLLFGTADDRILTGGSLQLRSDDRLVILRFDTQLPAGFYRASVRSGARDIAGNRSTERLEWSFRAMEGVDTDGDGMSDDFERANGFNPLLDDASGDPDQDGANNLAEFILGTHPRNARSFDPDILDGKLDRDGDTLTDVQEVFLGTNPLAADSDGDGWNDEAELATGSNPLDRREIPILSVTTKPWIRVMVPDRELKGPAVSTVVAPQRIRVSLPVSDSISGTWVTRRLGRILVPEQNTTSGAHLATPPIRLLIFDPDLKGMVGVPYSRQKPTVFMPVVDDRPGSGTYLTTPPVHVDPEPTPTETNSPSTLFPFPIADSPTQ